MDVTFNPSVFNGGYHVSCNGASDGTLEAIIVGGQPPYSFQWSTGAYTKTITNLAAGTYSISVIDAAQDTITKSYTLIASEALTGSLDVSTYGGGFNVSAQGAADGWITAVIGGGATPYTYQWSNGAETETNHELPSGSYSVIVRDVNQCQLQLSTSLSQPTPLHIVSITSPLHNGYNLSCKSSDDGAIDLTVSGGVAPYTYQWSNGNFTQDLADLKAGEYTVLVKDLNGVGVTASITLTQPGSIEVDLTAPTYPNGHHTTCYNCSNGSVTTTVTGGVMPYTYSWNTGQNTQNLSNLMAGTYSVLVTDANGCTKPDVKIDLTEPDRDDWTMTGNGGIIADSNFIGSTDSTDFVVRTNGSERIRVKANGEVNIQPGKKIAVSRITSPDSLIAFGDSSIVFNDYRHRIYVSGYSTLVGYRGLSIGTWCDAINQNSIAIGYSSRVSGDQSFALGAHLLVTQPNAIAIGKDFTLNRQNVIALGVNGTEPTMTVYGAQTGQATGTVAIGCDYTNSDYKLAVGGKIIAEELYIKLRNGGSGWPDYVFQPDYKLMSLSDLRDFVAINKHLPGIKMQQLVKSDRGVAVGDLQVALLEKIEELTLYIIQQDEKINRLYDLLGKTEK
ncbi:MAG: hypothetical protein JNN19_06955 [Bacteroidia bacterium]|nr:hypothetical protein [Bacteroidia bacterium]